MIRMTLAFLVVLIATAARADDPLAGPWPSPDSVRSIHGQSISFPSRSPFTLSDLDDADRTAVQATLFLPPGAAKPHSLPAVVMLHGAGGVLESRELTYGRQLAAMGVAALAIDSFGSRRDRGIGFTQRLLNITETMLVTDAYAALGYLGTRPEIDADHVVLVGFSYGAMATMYALNDVVARKLAPPGLRFAGHVSFYGPCIARFDRPRTTGAPLLMLYGDQDELIDHKRCAETADSFRAGGSSVQVIAYPGAVHQWDGSFERRLIGRNLANCDFGIDADGDPYDRGIGLPMTGSFMRKVLLVLCVEDRPYPIGRDDAVRARSNHDFGAFLARVFARPSG